MFLGAVAQNAVEEGTIIEINVTSLNGAHYETNLKLRRRSGIYPCTAGDGKIKNIRKFKKVLCIFKKSMIRYYSRPEIRHEMRV